MVELEFYDRVKYRTAPLSRKRKNHRAVQTKRFIDKIFFKLNEYKTTVRNTVRDV
jgi:hypothetical protein